MFGRAIMGSNPFLGTVVSVTMFHCILLLRERYHAYELRLTEGREVEAAADHIGTQGSAMHQGFGMLLKSVRDEGAGNYPPINRLPKRCPCTFGARQGADIVVLAQGFVPAGGSAYLVAILGLVMTT